MAGGRRRAIHCARRQRRRRPAGARPPRRDAGRRDRPDLGARRAQRLCPQRPDAARSRGACGAPTLASTRDARSPPWPSTSARCSGSSATARSSFDYGNNIRAQARAGRRRRRVRHSRLRARVHPPALLPGQGTVPVGGALGRSGRHRRDRRAGARDVQRRRGRSAGGSGSRASASRFRDCRPRIFWLGYGDRARFGLAINDLVRRGVVKAPIVIGRDHLDAGSVASPNRETEAMRDGSDAIADWPVLNALLNTASGATWVSVHHGGGVGIGYSLHAGHGRRGRRISRSRREAAARPDLRSRARGRAPRGRRLPGRNRHGAPHGIDMPCGWRIGTMMIPERPSLERRVLTALEGTASGVPRIPVVLGGCGTGRTSLLLRVRDLLGRSACQYIDVERIATTPERLFQAIRDVSPFAFQTSPRPPARGHDARGAPSTPRSPGSARARAPGDAPATFLLDEFLELRTFESFPGPALGAARSHRALAANGNRFVLTSRYIGARARASCATRRRSSRSSTSRRSAPPRSAPRSPRARKSTAPRLACPRPRTTARATSSRGWSRRCPKDAPPTRACSSTPRRPWPRAAPSIRSARSRRSSRPAAHSPFIAAICYELRLHRARGYGALKAILEVLAEEEPLTLTEISLRLRRTPARRRTTCPGSRTSTSSSRTRSATASPTR